MPGIARWQELDGIAEGSAEMEAWCRWYFKVARTIHREFQLQAANMRSDRVFMGMAQREGSVTATYQIAPTPSPFTGTTVYTITNINAPQTALGRLARSTLQTVAARSDILEFPTPRPDPVFRSSAFRITGRGGPPQYDQRCAAWIAEQNP